GLADVREVHERDAERRGRFEDPRVPVELAEDDALDAGVGDGLEAAPTRRRGHVEVGAVDAGAVLGGLDDGVHLGVRGADAVAVLHQVADLVAVRKAPDGAVVAGGQDAPIADDDGADVLAVAGAARGHLVPDRHEVFVPARPTHGAGATQSGGGAQCPPLRSPRPWRGPRARWAGARGRSASWRAVPRPR